MSPSVPISGPNSSRQQLPLSRGQPVLVWARPLKDNVSILSGASVCVGSSLTVASCGSVSDQGRWDLRYIWLAIVPQVAIELLETAVSGEWAVQS